MAVVAMQKASVSNKLNDSRIRMNADFSTEILTTFEQSRQVCAYVAHT